MDLFRRDERERRDLRDKETIEIEGAKIYLKFAYHF
jgi:hypothetical protein